jgi:hypothetical protein
MKAFDLMVSIGDSPTESVGDGIEGVDCVGILNHNFEENNLNIIVENFGIISCSFILGVQRGVQRDGSHGTRLDRKDR